MNTLYSEKQQFRQRWIWGLVTLSAVLALLGIEIAFRSVPAGKIPNFFWVQVGLFCLLFGLPMLLLYVCMLKTSVGTTEITLDFFPFHTLTGPKRISLSEISRVYAREYSPLGEFGGWGIRWAGKEKRAYNVSGNQGVTVELKDGTSVLIGSQHSAELEASIQKAMAEHAAIAHQAN